jgi:hypothetical protein
MTRQDKEEGLLSRLGSSTLEGSLEDCYSYLLSHSKSQAGIASKMIEP